VSIFNPANGTYTQPGKKSPFHEESRSTPWESTCSQASNQFPESIKRFASNYLPFYTIWRMTNVPDFISDPGWPYKSGYQWWWKWHWRVYHIIWHRRKQFASSSESPTSGPGKLECVITNDMGSTSKEMQPCWYRHCMPSADKFLGTTWGNGTTTAQTPKVTHSEQFIHVWPNTICPGTTEI